jgi:hypothetical protein
MKTTSTINRIATIAGLSLGAFALSVAAQTWTAPTQSAPNGNVAAPVNIGSILQTRLGDLVINGSLNVGGLGILSSNYVFKPSAAAVPVGSVLAAKDTGGTVEWKAPSGSIDFSGAGVVYNTTIQGNGGTSFVKVNAAGARGVILNMNKGGNECLDLKIELYSKAGSPSNAPTYAYGDEWGPGNTTQYQYLGYIFGATRDGTTRESGTVVTMPISSTGYIMLKSNGNVGTPCPITVTKIADIY